MEANKISIFVKHKTVQRDLPPLDYLLKSSLCLVQARHEQSSYITKWTPLNWRMGASPVEEDIERALSTCGGSIWPDSFQNTLDEA